MNSERRLDVSVFYSLLATPYSLASVRFAVGRRIGGNEHRPRGAEHGADKHRQTWLERRQQEAESLGSTTQPYRNQVSIRNGNACWEFSGLGS